jgi:predicted AAA+ superfamily ATPase
VHNKMAQGVEKLILDFLQKEYPKDFSIEEIAAETGVHRNTVSKYVFGLEKAGKLKNVRTIGRAKMYAAVEK